MTFTIKEKMGILAYLLMFALIGKFAGWQWLMVSIGFVFLSGILLYSTLEMINR